MSHELKGDAKITPELKADIEAYGEKVLAGEIPFFYAVAMLAIREHTRLVLYGSCTRTPGEIPQGLLDYTTRNSQP